MFGRRQTQGTHAVITDGTTNILLGGVVSDLGEV